MEEASKFSFLAPSPGTINCVFSIKYEYGQRKEWAPQLVETRYIFPPHASLGLRSNSSRSANDSFIPTPFSWLVGKPPTVVASTTQSTVEADFLSTAPRVGYRIKLVRGQKYNPVVPRSKVVEIQANAPIDITSNARHVGPYQFTSRLTI